MTARTHDAIAFAALITVATFNPPMELNLLTAGAAVVGNIIGSTIPDMDQAGNRLYKFLPAGNFFGKILRRMFLGHRAFSHSLIGLYTIYHILQFLLFRLLNPDYVNAHIVFAAMIIGYVSHLFGDMLTKDGLPLLFPLKFRFGIPPIEAFRITTGKWIENLIVLPGTAIYIFWFIGRYQEQIMSILLQIQYN
jgi:inner membrane protein